MPVGVAVSSTQLRLLRHVAHGLTLAQSARRLAIRPHAVSNRLTSLYRELEVGTGSRAVARGHELGLLEREPRPVPPLRDSQLDLLWRIARGESDVLIASRMRLHVSTVRHHLSRMYRDIGAKNRPNAIHLAYCAGVLGAAEGGVDE